jgi:hypothetical protein
MLPDEASPRPGRKPGAALALTTKPAWEKLARGKDRYFEVSRSGEDYERTWRRLLDDERIRGIAARLDGTMVGIAHYLFHASVWHAGRCYLADLFVDPARLPVLAADRAASAIWISEFCRRSGRDRRTAAVTT